MKDLRHILVDIWMKRRKRNEEKGMKKKEKR
jgi:hypothetical protein